MGHADGICHIYVDATADVETAVAVVVDGKTQYPAVCNATETLLVHRDVASALLPPIGTALLAKGVNLHCDPEAKRIMAAASSGHEQQVLAAQPDAFDTEWLSLDLSVKVVDSTQAAVEHVNTHGSGHTDVITQDPQRQVLLSLIRRLWDTTRPPFRRRLVSAQR